MDCNGWHKSMAHFSSMCFSSTLNPQVLFYYGYDRKFDDRTLCIFLRQNIQYFILKAGDYMHDETNYKKPKHESKSFV